MGAMAAMAAMEVKVYHSLLATLSMTSGGECPQAVRLEEL
jgi:hypothetical protein